jgi:hypothetical protein
MKILSFIISVLIFISCSTKEYKSNKKILKVVDNYTIEIGIKKPPYLVILPNQGCIGCITVAEDFLMRNAQHTNCIFILTSVMSLKLLKNKLGEEILCLPNVYIDSCNYIGNNIPQLIYPIVIFHDKPTPEIYFQKPESSAFRILRSRMTEKQ